MELRHLRYFLAVAEEGSLTVAAERRLHTAQPSLSRQIRDLEYEVGAQLLVRSARGVELTDSGRAFLDHARLALVQVDAAVEAARQGRTACTKNVRPRLSDRTGDGLAAARPCVSFGTNCPISRSTISSQYSPDLAKGCSAASSTSPSCAPSRNADLDYKVMVKEPLIVAMPSDHRLASQDTIAIQDIAGETFIGMSNTAPRSG